MPAITYEELRVPVRGGHLTVLRWPAADAAAPAVVALHGITSNALSWAAVARRLAGRVTLVAPDLRGRAGSSALPGPYGMAAHADDAVAVADVLGLRDAVLAGHSMGAFAAAVAGCRRPERFRSLLLVDGGVGFPVPPGLSTDDLLAAVLGPAMERLRTSFPDRAAYRAFWRRHPAFAPYWEPEMEAHLMRDLVGTEPELRSSCRLDAIRADGADTLGEETARAVHRLTVEGELLWAERGLLDEPQGLYDEQRLKAAELDTTPIRTLAVPGTNHYTLLLGDKGASVVADRLLTATGADPAASTDTGRGADAAGRTRV